jgi:hypothetical protein
MSRPRIAYIVWQYPLICETYIEVEIALLSEHYDIKVFSELDPQDGHLGEEKAPFVTCKLHDETVAAIREFNPDLLHAHWMTQMPRMHAVAEELDLRYTMRAHSFDVLPAQYMKHWFDHAPQFMKTVVDSGRCLGILTFPFGRPIFEQTWNVPGDMLREAMPVVDLDMFRDRTPNGDAVMNTGACTPKKKIGDYLILGRMCKERHFDYYPVAYRTEQIRQRNEQLGSPVEIHPLLPHSRMPAEFKKHEWMVYTADMVMRNVGWPLSVAEAQASGVGVVIADVRDDMTDFIGEAGYIYHSLEEARDIIRQPFPQERRELGFELAERCDARANMPQLTDLWKPVLESAA